MGTILLTDLVLHCEDDFINLVEEIFIASNTWRTVTNGFPVFLILQVQKTEDFITWLERLLKYDAIHHHLCRPKEVLLDIGFFTNHGNIVGSPANIELQQTFYTDHLNNLELLYPEG